jgi:hypothetical protein
VGAWDVGACARDGGAIKGDGVGVVGGDGVEGMAEQVLEGGVGVEVVLEVSVVAVGDVPPFVKGGESLNTLISQVQ